MTGIDPRTRDQLEELEPVLQGVEAAMGFVPNSFLTMAHWPQMLTAFSGFAGTILGPGEVPAGLKQLVAYVTSRAAGCQYCQAHTSHVAEHRGVSRDKIAAAFEFESSELFTDAERAALRVALYGGIQPNGVEQSHLDELRTHYSDREIVEIVGVIALFGFLNRWNDTLATTLEPEPMQFANDVLAPSGWNAGKHGDH